MTVALGPDRFDPRVAPLRVMARLDGGVANPTRLPALVSACVSVIPSALYCSASVAS